MSFRRLLTLAVTAGFFLAVFCTVAIAQYRAGVQGVVTDNTGAVVPGATVTLTSKETNNSRTATTSGNGVYSIPSLAPGNYSITADKEGFQKKTLDNVTVSAEQMQAVNIELGVGQTSQTVTVSANAVPALNTETATVGGTITTRQIESTPTFARDPFQLLQLAPGTFGDNARQSSGATSNLPGNAGPGGTSATSSIFQTENQVQVSANGLRTTSNSYQIDGVSVNSLAWGGAAVVTPNEESVKEVRVESNAYSAENGRAGGAQVMVVSKNGTNDWHGSFLMRAARPGLNAYQRWNGPTADVQRNTDRFNQFAGSVGGPIVKNRLFFFFSYETLRNNTTATGTGWYETPQFLSLVQAAKPGSIASQITSFPGEGASISSIAQNADCAFAGIAACQEVRDGSGNLLGLDVGSPLAAPLGTRDPSWQSATASSPVIPGVGGGLDGIPDIMNVNTLNPTRSTAQQFNGRLDYQMTNSDLLAFSTYQVPVDTTNFNGPVRSANLWNNSRLNQSGTFLWNHTFSPSILNEARVSASRWHWNEIESNPQEPWGLPTSNIDALNVANVNYFGAPGPSTFSQTTYNFRDTASWMKHSHAIKFGTDIYWEQNNDSQTWSARPTFGFRNLWDFANDAPYSEAGNFDPRTGSPTAVKKYIRSWIYSGFVQDDWKVLPNLTLNLGLRWEYFTPITEKNGQISNAILGSGSNTLTDLRLKLGGNLYNASKNNWGPQIGFAWTPHPNTAQLFVIRGGFGIGYTRMEEAITLNGRSNIPFVSGVNFIDTGINYAIPGDVHQFFDWPANPATQIAFDPVTNLPVNGTGIVLNIFPQDLPTTTTYRYSLDTQYSLPSNWVATIGYQGSTTRHYTRQVNLNWFYPQNLNPTLQAVQYYPNDANANFNALLGQLSHQFSQNFQLDFQYRWSKAIDDGSNEYNIGEYPFDLSFLRGLADYDSRHNIKLLGLWSPRIFAAKDWREKVLGGWTISSILNWHTGFPFTPLYPTGCNVIYTGSNYCNLRPAAYLGGAGENYSVDTFRQQNGNFPGGALTYFVPPTFATDGTIPPPPGVGRNTFRGPGYFSVDMTLQKSFGLPTMKVIGEGGRIEFRADFFNIFNKLNLTQVQTNVSSANFGQAQSALAGRIINLQARFSF